MEEWLYIQTEVYPALLKGFWVSLALIAPLGRLRSRYRDHWSGCSGCTGAGPSWPPPTPIVALFRGVPLVVQLFIWYFGLPYIKIYLSPFTAAVLGFSLCSGAYHSEYIRGALLSIKRGQMLAAQSLGFSTVRMIVSIILPQAIRRALPGCGNEIIYLIKYSSLAYMITCIELTGQGKILASNSFKYTEIFLIIGACYLAMTSVASIILSRLEDRLRLPGFEHHRI